MITHILELDYKKDSQLEAIFKGISEGNTILFLGAGASVANDKKFLSQDIIEFFEDKKQISWNIKDITEFVDALSNNINYSRDEFDNYVDECLRKLEITEGHRTIAKTPWRLIITTNYDLLIERAFAEVENTHEEVGRLKVVHARDSFNGISAKTEIKYVKLHGCICDKRLHKLIFSSDDFKKAHRFYKAVLNELRNLSDNVTFLSIGYSYSDEFAKRLLERIDSYNFRERRIIYNIDPYINEAVLPTYTAKRICVIKATMKQFFEEYQRWKQERDIIAKINLKGAFTNHQNDDLYIPTHIGKRVGDKIKQLNSFYRSRVIPESEFYKGGEPDYNIILKNYDVVKAKKISEVKNFIFQTIEHGSEKSRIIPLFFLTGTFGTGKSTFTYRLLHQLNRISTPAVSFEIIDPSELSAVDLKEIFQKSGAGYIFLYINTIEINSVFKSLLDLRNKLSIEVSPEAKIVIIATIRENILLKYKEDKEIKNSFAINIDCPFEKEEIDELVDKLKNSGIIQFRDIAERKLITTKIAKEFQGDSFVSLLELVQGNKLIEDLLQAYHQLSEKCQKAFIYTSLLYQYKILMPSGLLRNLISSDWEEFRKDVIEKDGKGILIQEVIESKGTDPDLYFRTKHPVISQRLIDNLLGDEEIRFRYIKSIVTHILTGIKNSKLTIDFFKALIANKHLPYAKIDHLYDLADEHLAEDPYFLLHYAINLQKRQNEDDILKAIAKIRYAESISENAYRNHYLIHRRGVLHFELAKLIFKRNDKNEFYKVLKHIDEARDFLQIKKAIDPFSSFSYTDLLNLEVWCLEKFQESKYDKLRRRIVIDELFDTAIRTVYENAAKIYEVKNQYIQKHKFSNNEIEYVHFLRNYYEDKESRPYALVLLFNHYLSKDDYPKCNQYLPELESLSLNAEILKLLLKYYGRNLWNASIRVKFFNLIKSNPELEDTDPLRFYYFNFVAECYNRNFTYAHKFLLNIKEKFNQINPDFHQTWMNSETNTPVMFVATLKINRYGKRQFYISDLNLWVKSENWDKNWVLNTQFDVELHFYIYGVRAKAINIISEEYGDDQDVDKVELQDSEL